MRLHRFYISEKIGSQKELVIDSAELVNQISRVFRLRTGDRVILFDGSGSDFECEICEDSIDTRGKRAGGVKSIRLVVREVSPSGYMPARKVVLYQAIIKKDKFEWVVEKATELGVTDIIPVLAERSEKKSLDQKRLQKIAIEASEQCGRGDVPVIHSAISRRFIPSHIERDLEKFSDASSQNVAIHLEGEEFSFSRRGLEEGSQLQPLALFIGPEGGWSPAELEMFHKQKIQICSLGKQVLRAETAAIVALSKVLM